MCLPWSRRCSARSAGAGGLLEVRADVLVGRLTYVLLRVEDHNEAFGHEEKDVALMLKRPFTSYRHLERNIHLFAPTITE